MITENIDQRSFFDCGGKTLVVPEIDLPVDNYFDYVLDNCFKDVVSAINFLPPGHCILLSLDEDTEDLTLEISYTDGSFHLPGMTSYIESCIEITKQASISSEMARKGTVMYGAKFIDDLVAMCPSFDPSKIDCLIPIVYYKSSYDGEKMSYKLDFRLVKHPDLVQLEPKKKKTNTKPKVKEIELEDNLIEWMASKGIRVERQVVSGRNRLDLWIPGKIFIELKRGKVTGDDVCQSIDYCVSNELPVVIVGNHISEMASRGIEAFNKAVNTV